jgi:hypothetical protein
MHVGTYGRLQDGNIRYLISCDRKELEEEILDGLGWAIDQTENSEIYRERARQMRSQIEKVLEQEP